MALRVTQQYIEALGSTSTSLLRVTQQYVEVLGPFGSLQMNVQDTILLTETEEHIHIIPGVTYVRDTLFFVESVNRRSTILITDTFSLSEDFPPHAIDEIIFTETVQALKGGRVIDTVTFTETVAITVSYNRAITDTVVLTEAAIPLVISNCTPLDYSPFGNLAPEPPINEGLLRLKHDTTIIILRNPEFLDRNSLTFARINRVTRGGTLILFTDPIWPKFQTLTLDIKLLKLADVDALKSFLAATLGQEIILTDWLGQNWTGVITNPQTDIAQTGRSLWQVTLIFEGEEGILSGKDDSLTLTDTVTTTVHRRPSFTDTLVLTESGVGISFTGQLGVGMLEASFMLGDPP